MAVTFRAATGSQSSTTALNISATQPAGATTGDLVFVGITVKDAQTFSAVSGWTLEQNANSNSNVSTTAVYYRVLDGTESWPITFAWTGSSVKRAWVVAAFTPGAGNVMAIDGEAAVKVDTTATTHTANSQTAVAANVCSVIFNLHRNSASGATGATVTPPTNWTEPANGDQTTASGTTTALSQLGAEVCYRTGQSGTVTPGSCTLSLTGTQNTYHFLITDLTPADSPALELSGFGADTLVHSYDTINSVKVSYTHHETAGTIAPTLQLWDGASAQIGATFTCTTSTGDITDTASFGGVTYAQLATLRVRVFAHGTTGHIESADAVGIVVNYAAGTPPPAAPAPQWSPGWHPAAGPSTPGGTPFEPWPVWEGADSAPAAASASVTGVAAPVTVTGGTGALSAGGNVAGAAAPVAAAAPPGVTSASANVTGTAAPVTVTGAAGALSSAANITGVAALVTVTGGAGAASAGGAANVAGQAAPVTAAGGTGTPSGSVAITGIAAPVATAGPAGTPAAGANIAGAAAAVAVASPAGVAFGGVTVATIASQAVSLTGPDVLPGLPGGQAFEPWPVWEGAALGVAPAGAAVTGIGAPVTVAAGAGVPSADANITGQAAAVAVASPAGVFAGSAGVTGTAAPVTAASPAGTAASSASLTGTGAPVTVAAPAGAPSSSANLTGTGALVTVAGGIGVAFGGTSGAANITGIAASVTVAAPAGVPHSATAITGIAAPVTVAGGQGTASIPVNVTGIGARVTVAAPAGALVAAANAAGLAALITVLAAPGTAVGGVVFTVGALTASTAPGATLSASDAPGGTSGGRLTATDTRTGGPGG